MGVTKELSKALVEIETLVQNLSQEVLDKIPKSFICFVEENKDKEYKFEYEIQKPMEEQDFSDMTLGVIGLMYQEFICDGEEKRRYQLEIDELKAELENEKREKYKVEDIFTKKREIKGEYANQRKGQGISIISEEKWYQKTVKAIKEIFKRKE